MNDTLKKIAGRGLESVKGELIGLVFFLGAIWAVFLLNTFLPLNEWLALEPRKLRGMVGIIAMPFLHSDLRHILSNTFPLFVLIALLAGSRANTWQVVIGIILGSGTLLWIGGFERYEYVGASMLIFGLIGFLVPSGFLEKRPIPMIISMVVGIMYGWTFLIGMLPLSREISELAHFYGAITGVALAFLLARLPASDPAVLPASQKEREWA